MVVTIILLALTIIMAFSLGEKIRVQEKIEEASTLELKEEEKIEIGLFNLDNKNKSMKSQWSINFGRFFYKLFHNFHKLLRFLIWQAMIGIIYHNQFGVFNFLVHYLPICQRRSFISPPPN